MVSFIAINGRTVQHGGYLAVMDWARQQVTSRQDSIVKIIKARGGEKYGSIIFEVTSEGSRPIQQGRIVKLSSIRHGLKKEHV